MKRVLVIALVLFTAVGMSFGALVESIQYSTTKGLFYNNIDNGQDATYIIGLDKNYLSLGSRSLGQMLYTGSTLGQWTANFGMTDFFGFNLSVNVEDKEFFSNNGVVNEQTNVVYAAPIKTSTYTSQINDVDNPYRNFTVGLGMKKMNMGLVLNFNQSGVKTNGTFTVDATGLTLGTISVAETIETNANTNISKTSTLIGLGYDDNFNISFDATYGMIMGKMSVYVPLSVANTGRAVSGSETNLVEDAVSTTSSISESYVKNDKLMTLVVKPEVWLEMNKNMTVIATIGSGMCLYKDITNTAYNYYSADLGSTNMYTTNENVTISNNFYLPLSIGVGAEFNAKPGDKLTLKARPRIDCNILFSGYDERTGQSWRTDELGVVNTYDGVSAAVGYSYNNYNLTLSLPVAVEYKMLDNFTLRFGSKFNCMLDWNYEITRNLDTYDNVNSTNTVTPAAGNVLQQKLTATSITTIEFASGFGWVPVENFLVDMGLTATITGNSVFGAGFSLLSFGNWSAQFTYQF